MKVYKSKKAKEKIISTYNQLLQAWGIPVKEVDVATSYGSTHVNVCGNPQGEPLVLFHGVGDDSALMWIYNIQALAEVFHVFAVDTIGGPGKSVPGSNYNKDFADEIWIDQILDYFKLEKVNLMGVSHGGFLVQYYTLMRNSQVKRGLCLASTVAVNEGDSPMKTMMKVFFPEALLPTAKNTKKLIQKMTGENSGAFTDNELVMTHFMYVMRGFNNMAMGYHKTIGFTDEQIDTIRDKCMYYIGEEDPFSKLGGRQMQEKYKMHTVFFPKVGHGINHEIAEKINEMAVSYFCG